MIKKIIILYFILLALCIPKIIYAAGFTQFQPYMGYGVGSFTYGDKTVYDGTVKGFLLGIKFAINISDRFLLFADYSRIGPVNYVSSNTQSDFYSTKSVFNIFSGGAGVQYESDRWTCAIGYYPYDHFIEYTKDFRFKGNLKRASIGVPLNNLFKVQFYYDLHSLVGDKLTDADRTLLCNYPFDNCKDVGEFSEVGFYISSSL